MITFYAMIIFYTKWWFLEIEVGLFGLLIINFMKIPQLNRKYHNWTVSILAKQQKKEKGRKNNKQG